MTLDKCAYSCTERFKDTIILNSLKMLIFVDLVLGQGIGSLNFLEKALTFE